MAEYFMSRLSYFQEPEAGVKIKPESEISCHITLTTGFYFIFIGLFHTRYLHYCS